MLFFFIFQGFLACHSFERTPASEICDNQIDDDGDNKIDCHDPDCEDAPPCQDCLGENC